MPYFKPTIDFNKLQYISSSDVQKFHYLLQISNYLRNLLQVSSLSWKDQSMPFPNISYIPGTHALLDNIHTCPRAVVHIYQAKHECLGYNLYIYTHYTHVSCQTNKHCTIYCPYWYIVPSIDFSPEASPKREEHE